MKETVKVNLGGRLFNLDKDAYDKLKNYLDTLERKFSSSPDEAKEIVEDIEARIAELLETKLGDKKEVVLLEDVEEVIVQLGTAEDMDGPGEESGPEQETEQGHSTNFTRTKKRFYRDIDHSIVGGVGSGLGKYFDIDPIWIRLIFVGLFFAELSGLIIYVILWIVIPPARTRAQKLEMEGRPVNIDNIGDSVKNEYEKVKNSVKNARNSKGVRDVENSLAEFFRVLGSILLIIIKIIGAIVGVSIIVALVVALVSLFAGGAILFPFHWFHGWNWPCFHGFGWDWPHFTFVGLCLFLVIALPIFALLIQVVKWVFDIKNRNGVAAGIGATVWVLALISLIVMMVTGINHGAIRTSFHTEHTFKPNSKELMIDVDLADNSNHRLEHYRVFDLEITWDEWRDNLLKHPDVEIVRWNEDFIKVDVYRTYLDFQIGRMIDDREDVVDYDWRFTGSRLTLDEYFTVDDDYIWRLPNLEIVLTVPGDMEIAYSNDAKNTLDLGYEPRWNRDEDDEGKYKNIERKNKEELLEELEDSLAN